MARRDRGMAWTAVAVVRLAQAARARGTMRVGALNKPEDQQASFRERYSRRVRYSLRAGVAYRSGVMARRD